MFIQLDADRNYQKCCVEPLINQWKRSTDFLVINPALSRNKNKYIYAAATLGSRQTLPHFPFDTVVKLNVLNQSIHTDRKSTRLNSSHAIPSRMPSSA